MVTLLESLSCCYGRVDHCGEAGEKCDEDQLRRRGCQKQASPENTQLEDDPGLAETVRLAEQLLPNGTMTQWQRRFCTARNIRRYLDGRGGNPAAAADIFAQALRWREEYREVLSGEREPKWQTDLRVLARGEAGHPIIYGCFRFNVPATQSTTQHIIEHMAAVMEAAANAAKRRGVVGADTVMDCHGYRVADNLNPAPMLALMRMANQPYRDGLRTAIVVDAPQSFQLLWRAAKPLLSEKTKQKIRFVSREEALKLLVALNGPQATEEVDRVMRLNRGTAEGCRGSRFPSELRDDDADGAGQEDDEQESFSGQALARRLTRRLTQHFSKTGQHGQKVCQRRRRVRFPLSGLMCCRRRVPIADAGA
mmetsp:Transcript_28297/g.71076  ORF Transcript_28297/g.71076 Transcript_28297/m.71076 type:complete len:366 (+) Transcript_28297:90-1187(+)